ncbi:hypothetical protein [Amycolatopsis nigrescens]|uniref:hypothetical protein n=1 Tax=Amycolatopsis nigrescens TaxID=381445 RepID=UPI0003999F98|nr:hypothetical protein [Amycolatopsis nigrescens]
MSQVQPEDVERALRSVRSASYRLAADEDGTTLALVMRASEPGRRNAASRIVRLLTEHGLTLGAVNPVEALTLSEDPLLVMRRRE